MTARPTGTVSFLFTDIAGSTRLWDEDFDGMSQSLAVHDRILLGAIADHGGFVFSTAGDSYGAAFVTALDAVEAAVQAQLALGSETWPGPSIGVRMGIHTGSSEERAGNYFGPDVNRAARVMSAANEGQILLSGVAARLLQGGPGSAVEIVDRGTHALKDLERPEHLFEARHPQLPEVSAPLHTVEADRLHVPAQLSSFVGREVELHEIADLVGSNRLVTLTGVGGTGKTRLSIEAAGRVQHEFPDGVWMVELAPITDPALVVDEVADVWSLRASEDASLLEVLLAHLADKRLLLVLDNCEHVLEAASALAVDVLTSSRRVSVLATSRESLGVRGEVVYRVPSMALPADDELAAASDAVRLFLDRATRVRPGFGGDPADIGAALRICRRLDGIPLGIELAAARVRSLGVSELADRLDESFAILTGGSKTAIPRQRTLQTAIDWSYDLLEEPDAALFRRMSVFSGGFDLGAAEAIGTGRMVEAWQVVDLLDQLVDKSLVVASHDSGRARYRLLEPIRQYAQEQLASSGEAPATRRAHADHFTAVVADQAARLRGRDQAAAKAELQIELDNIRAALATLLDQGDVAGHLRIAFDLTFFWAISSLLVEGRDVLRTGLEAAEDEGVAPGLVALAWFSMTHLSIMLTDPRGVECAERGVAAAERAGDSALRGWLLAVKAMASNMVGAGPDLASADEGLALIAEHPEDGPWDPDWAAAMLDLVRATSGVPEAEQRELVSRAMERFSALGDEFMVSQGPVMATHLFADRPEWLLARLRESAATLRELDARHGLGHALFHLGVAQQDLGVGPSDLELTEGAALLAGVGDLPCSTWCSMRLVGAKLDDGDVDGAGRVLAAAAGRLLGFERVFESDLASLACRFAMERGDYETAARMLGSLEASGRSSETIEECRREISVGLGEEPLARLRAEGASADQRRILRWVRDSVPDRVGPIG